MCDLKFVRVEILRVSLTQEMQEILGCGDASLHRKVQVIVPPSPPIFIGVDIDAADIGMNKTFNQPPMYPGQFLEFPLGTAQKLYGATGIGNVAIAIVVEHYMEATP